MGNGTELGRVGTLHDAAARPVSAGTIDQVFVLDNMSTLGQTVEIIVRGAVFWRTVRTVVPATELADRFHTGSTLVKHLNEVIVAIGSDGDTDPDAVTDLQLNIRGRADY